MAFIIKRLLQDAAEELYSNTANPGGEDRVATNIVMCNVSPAPANVFLFFVKSDYVDINQGAVVYNTEISVGETLEIKDRIVPSGYKIFSYCSTGVDLVALSIDVLGDSGEFVALV